MPEVPLPTITQYEYLLALQKEGHFGRAAAVCHVSQPTLSAQIQKLESELGLVVFDRQAKPIAPTEPGRRVLELAREVVAAHERLLSAAAGGLSELGGPFTLGIIPTLAPYVLPWFLGDFARRYPSVDLTLLERPTEVIVREIHANRMDAAVLATPIGEASLEEEVLFYDPFYVYAHPDSPLLADTAADVDDIEPGGLWLLDDGHCFRAQVVNLCGLHTRDILGTVRFAGGSFETLRGLIDANGGHTLIPETYAMRLPKDVRKRQVRPIRDRIPTREVSLLHHRSSWKTDIREALLRVLRESVPPALADELADGEVMSVYVR